MSPTCVGLINTFLHSSTTSEVIALSKAELFIATHLWKKRTNTHDAPPLARKGITKYHLRHTLFGNTHRPPTTTDRPRYSAGKAGKSIVNRHSLPVLGPLNPLKSKALPESSSTSIVFRARYLKESRRPLEARPWGVITNELLTATLDGPKLISAERRRIAEAIFMTRKQSY
ncbi:hypothetical protein EVAR_62706_1 [Eumeta japonica]|uniref:Uncharacterized protein n=1 Tax=Eumeta variegata TaxID=151549 RepID=A0A4C1ZIR0_EUMVA|nr:hypothetical protein EVAR_62706_1 [Eumeta japonica]